MTFTELQTEIMDRLNLSSTTAQTRIGRAINRKYRQVTSAIGLELSRRITVQATMSPGVSTLTFTNVEKIINVYNRNVTPYKQLDLYTIDELRQHQPYQANDKPTWYAIASQTNNSVTIEINRIPQTALVLYADVHQAVADLSGSQTPAFPESFHDVIIEGVLADELRKMEKPALSQIAAQEYQRILSDLRMWVAKGGPTIYAGKMDDTLKHALGSSSGGSGGAISIPNGTASYTQTGLITFQRGASAVPFAIADSPSGKVVNLNADLLDGQDWTSPTITTPTIASFVNSQHNHQNAAGGGTLSEAALALTDVTTNNVSTSAHGFMVKAPNDVTKFWRGDGSYATLWTSVTVTDTGGPKENYAPGLVGNTIIYCNNATALTIGGLANGYAGQRVVFLSIGAGNVSFVNQSAGSSPGNKLLNYTTSANTSIAAGVGYAEYVYDSSSRWRLINHEQGGWLAWTPIDASGAGLTITNNSARYRLSGRTVQAMYNIVYQATADATAAAIGGLPYTCEPLNWMVNIGYSDQGAAFTALVNSSTTKMSFWTVGGGNMSNANFSGKTIEALATYQTT